MFKAAWAVLYHKYATELFRYSAALFQLSAENLVIFKAFSACSSVWKAQSRVLEEILGRVFCQREFLKIWSVKGAIYTLESN